MFEFFCQHFKINKEAIVKTNKSLKQQTTMKYYKIGTPNCLSIFFSRCEFSRYLLQFYFLSHLLEKSSLIVYSYDVLTHQLD